jgi:hypothetical protein
MTLIREASVKEASTIETLYCIEHERMVEVENGVHIEGWTYEEVKSCTFPLGYAFVAPPFEPPYDAPHDWAAQDVSEEERALAEIEEQGMWLGGGE